MLYFSNLDLNLIIDFFKQFVQHLWCLHKHICLFFVKFAVGSSRFGGNRLKEICGWSNSWRQFKKHSGIALVFDCLWNDFFNFSPHHLKFCINFYFPFEQITNLQTLPYHQTSMPIQLKLKIKVSSLFWKNSYFC